MLLSPNVKVRGASGYAAKRPSQLTGWLWSSGQTPTDNYNKLKTRRL